MSDTAHPGDPVPATEGPTLGDPAPATEVPTPSDPAPATEGPPAAVPPRAAKAAPTPTPSALAEALTIIGDRWSLLIVAALIDAPRRFGELQSEVGGIAPNILTQRLRHLERHALLVARPYSERPARFVYELSAAGRELAAPLRLLAGWGAAHLGGEAIDAALPRHGPCGTPMQVRWWCPVCEQVAPEDTDEELHFA